LLSRVIGSHLHLLFGFQIHQDSGLAEYGPNFLRIEDVKEDDLVAVEAQRLDGANDAFGRFIEIGNDHDQAAPAEKLLKVAHRLAEVGARARLGELESAQEPGELP